MIVDLPIYLHLSYSLLDLSYYRMDVRTFLILKETLKTFKQRWKIIISDKNSPSALSDNGKSALSISSEVTPVVFDVDIELSLKNEYKIESKSASLT